jgi:hypothetical protein
VTTSNQPLGDKTVLVECDDDFFLVELVYIDGFEVPARCFSEAQLAEWSKDIRAEYESDLAEREECAREEASERAAWAREEA